MIVALVVPRLKLDTVEFEVLLLINDIFPKVESAGLLMENPFKSTVVHFVLEGLADKFHAVVLNPKAVALPILSFTPWLFVVAHRAKPPVNVLAPESNTYPVPTPLPIIWKAPAPEITPEEIMFPAPLVKLNITLADALVARLDVIVREPAPATENVQSTVQVVVPLEVTSVAEVFIRFELVLVNVIALDIE